MTNMIPAGHCQICERLHAVKKGRIVKHGYLRPGHGWLVGECSGSREQPYELSCVALGVYKAAVERFRAAQCTRQNDIEAGTIVELPETYTGGSRTSKMVKPGEPFWGMNVEQAIGRCQYQIRLCDADIARCEQRITAWTLHPLTEKEGSKEPRQFEAGKAYIVYAKPATVVGPHPFKRGAWKVRRADGVVLTVSARSIGATFNG